MVDKIAPGPSGPRISQPRSPIETTFVFFGALADSDGDGITDGDGAPDDDGEGAAVVGSSGAGCGSTASCASQRRPRAAYFESGTAGGADAVGPGVPPHERHSTAEERKEARTAAP